MLVVCCIHAKVLRVLSTIIYCFTVRYLFIEVNNHDITTRPSQDDQKFVRRAEGVKVVIILFLVIFTSGFVTFLVKPVELSQARQSAG